MHTFALYGDRLHTGDLRNRVSARFCIVKTVKEKQPARHTHASGNCVCRRMSSDCGL